MHLSLLAFVVFIGTVGAQVTSPPVAGTTSAPGALVSIETCMELLADPEVLRERVRRYEERYGYDYVKVNDTLEACLTARVKTPGDENDEDDTINFEEQFKSFTNLFTDRFSVWPIFKTKL